MSTKIKSKQQKVIRLPEHLDETDPPKKKKLKSQNNPSINLVNRSEKTVKPDIDQDNIPENQDHIPETKKSQLKSDEKDNQLIKLNLETLNEISKNDTIQENSSLPNDSTSI